MSVARRLAVHAQERQAGLEMVISYPVNLFSLDLRARKHLMLAGGIGITPFMAQTAQLAAEGGNFELHYTCRTASLGTYADVLRERYDRRSGSTMTTATSASSSTGCCRHNRSARISMFAALRHDRLGARRAPRWAAIGDRAFRAFRGTPAWTAVRRDAGGQRQDDQGR